jgi:aspartyl-tRNA(Asn)/glutamyl-tRNA(Gln) amidotransferase subunit B
MQKAIEFEIDRQIAVYEAGGEVQQETRLWDEKNSCTRVMRTKEDAHDYRYFPEPDLQPLRISEAFIEEVRRTMPELPDQMRSRFIETYGLNFSDASQIVADRDFAEFYETVARLTANPKLAANWVLGEFTRLLNEGGLTARESLVSPEDLAELLQILESGKINNNQAKEVFAEMFASGAAAPKIIAEKGYEQISDPDEIARIIDDVIEENSKQVEAYRAGNAKLFGFFVGQVMKASGGKANPKIVNEQLKLKLG